VAVLLPCRIRTKSQNARTIEGEEQRLSVWRVVNDDRFQTKYDSAFFQRKTAVPKNPSSDAAGNWLIGHDMKLSGGRAQTQVVTRFVTKTPSGTLRMDPTRSGDTSPEMPLEQD
jgi:hypothetical protein